MSDWRMDQIRSALQEAKTYLTSATLGLEDLERSLGLDDVEAPAGLAGLTKRLERAEQRLKTRSAA